MNHLFARCALWAIIAVGLATLSASADIVSPHGQLKWDCQVCHVTENWKAAPKSAQFDHTQTGFILEGRHQTVRCRDCHSTLVFRGTATRCIGCHADIHHAQFALECGQCHTTRGWNNLSEMYQRHSQTRFPLTGVHAALDCQSCHATGQFAALSTDCRSCHATAYEQTTDPNHMNAGFSPNCAQCHSAQTAGWKTSYNHPATFPLTGGHAIKGCAVCHRGTYQQTSHECFSCHSQNFQGAPNHVAGGYPQTCEMCHTVTTWQTTTFDHNLTHFPLTGAHGPLECSRCHTNGQFTGTPTACYDCHQNDFARVRNPDHAAGQFSHACLDCHTTVVWTPSTFNHANTSFPLTGSHGQQSCQACHVNGQFAGTPTDCYSCHRTAYEQAADPNHVTGQFNHNCAICHNTAVWQPSTFDHNQTGFSLTGRHGQITCQQCHINGQFPGTPTDCYTCHRTAYEQATDPNHMAAQLDHNCALCHSTSVWQPSTFDHNQTVFPLTGRHAQTACQLCHVNGQFPGTPTACYACHQTDYQNAADPNHVAAQLDHNCALCHSTSVWQPSTFDHNQTVFPLTGRHGQIACQQCHVNGQFPGTPTACYDCHRTNFESVTDPNHVTLQFSHLCADCHSTTDWSPATFDHSGTIFPLTGAHVNASCGQCHINGQYQGTPTACFFCHETDYNTAQNPNHLGAHFPTDCATCHTTFNWNSTFNHDGPYFPIYSGNHRTAWTLCSDCHTNPNDYAVFSCIDCHSHLCPTMNNRHQDVSGYSCVSSECYRCHPRGSAGDSPQLRSRIIKERREK